MLLQPKELIQPTPKSDLKRPFLSYFFFFLFSLFLAALAFALAYQARPAHKIDLGEPDTPYVINFNTPEPSYRNRLKADYNGVSYRWSKGESKIELPGLGSQPLTVTIRYTPGANPKPSLSVLVNGNELASQPPVGDDKGFFEHSFVVPPGFFANGDLTLTLRSNSFVPKDIGLGADPRELGLLIDWLKIEPSTTSGGWLAPPQRAYWSLVAIAGLGALLWLGLGMPVLWQMVASSLLIAGLSYWLVNARLSLSVLLEQDVVGPLGWLVVTAIALSFGLPRVFGWLGLPTSRRDTSWLAGLFVLQFSLLYFVQLHPQFSSSDVGLSYRHLMDVRDGKFVFSELLPDNKTLSPYPPAFYFLALPFVNLTGLDRPAVYLLIETLNSLLIGSGVFLVYYMARLLAQAQSPSRSSSFIPHPSTLAVLAAAFYTISRYPFLIFSQGNHANLFGAWAFLLAMGVVAGTLQHFRRSQLVSAALAPQVAKTRRFAGWRYLLPVPALLLAFLSHYGTFLFTNVFMGMCIGLLVVLGGRAGRRQALYLGFSWLLALALSFAIYFHLQIGVMSQQFGRSSGSGGSFKPFDALRNIYGQLRDDFGLILLLAVGGYIAVWLTKRWTSRVVMKKKARRRWWQLEPVEALLLAVFLTGGIFVLAEQVQGLPTRYQLYLVTAMTVLAGAFLDRLWQSGWAGRVLVTGLFLFQLLGAVLFWLQQVTYYFLPP